MQLIRAKLNENDATVQLQTEAVEEQKMFKSLDDAMSPMFWTETDTEDPDEPSS